MDWHFNNHGFEMQIRRFSKVQLDYRLQDLFPHCRISGMRSFEFSFQVICPSFKLAFKNIFPLLFNVLLLKLAKNQSHFKDEA